MALDDIQKFSEGLRNERRRLEDSDTVHEADRPVITSWMKRKDGSVAISSMKTYLRRVRIASERSTVPLVEGEATITIDGEEVAMTAGDAIRVPPNAARQIANGDTESTLVLVGAP